MHSYLIDLAVCFGVTAFFVGVIPQRWWNRSATALPNAYVRTSLLWALGIWSAVAFLAITADHLF